ncbi:N-methylhydantoinase A [Stella humosa]|uniref:N-methylhydantoinase A n=1 Tax=Stella humosa TaxID=94 RepID=A0A3N1MIS7_9PROT|nr:hydantoinase/oxoprolinase family protein [Stella humosa]ROQ01036.1 N-methylhydantoinase A [Stella humosa]BBK31405.1 hydantoinase [Stella humosa]
MYRVGVEIGGTFTDLVAFGPDGVSIRKVPSVPARPDEGAFAALAASGLALDGIGEFVHGSTVATNAVLERKGGRLAFIVTEGFRDILLLQRHDRTRIFDLFYKKPEPLAARADTFTVAERITGDGQVLAPLDLAAVGPALKAQLSGGYDAVAICLLNGFLNPAHEQALAAWIAAELPELRVTCSHRVTGEFREYERATATTMSAFVQPVVDGYLGRIEDGLTAAGFTGRCTMMQSNGGRVPFRAIRDNPITALLSGPAAGVTGAVKQAGLSGFKDIITLDIGGTSADVALVRDGKPDWARETKIDGLPIRMPMVDIVTIGAGGGSIVWADDGGMLRVGPESAGAAPGPACYGKGGTRPTLTDAHVLCGRLPAAARLAGHLSLDAAAAAAAFAPIAAGFGRDPIGLAEDASRLADGNIVAAIRLVSTERGRDPREFALVPYGGAGPLHAARVADALGVSTVVVPPDPGVISAYGLLVADQMLDETRTRRTPLDDKAPDAVRETFAGLHARLTERAAELGLEGTPDFEFSLDMRYVGQAYEIDVAVDPATIDRLDTATIASGFAAAHKRIYEHGAVKGKAVEIVSYRARLRLPQGDVPALRLSDRTVEPAEAIQVFEGDRWVDATRVGRPALASGAALAGPAVVTDTTATTYVPPGWTATTDAHDNLILRRSA